MSWEAAQLWKRWLLAARSRWEGCGQGVRNSTLGIHRSRPEHRIIVCAAQQQRRFASVAPPDSRFHSRNHHEKQADSRLRSGPANLRKRYQNQRLPDAITEYHTTPLLLQSQRHHPAKTLAYGEPEPVNPTLTTHSKAEPRRTCQAPADWHTVWRAKPRSGMWLKPGRYRSCQ